MVARADEFEKRFDTKVTMDFYEDESSMMAKLQGGGSAQYARLQPLDRRKRSRHQRLSLSI